MTVSAAEPQISRRQVFAFIAMVFGMFMAILDIQVVSASLKEIQAGLSASSDEIAWVQTAYLIAEVIMIPLSGFLSRLMSTRLLFTLAAAGFTASSFLCSTATNIDQMIIYRALQGFLGGGMIPSVFAAAYTIFPASKRPIITPVIGLVATMAPTVGPTIGGYLSFTMSWHWLFLVNIVPGILVAIAAFVLIDFDKPDWKLLNNFDWYGLISMAAFLGALEYVLEEGPLNDWMDDRTVATFTVIMVIGAIIFFIRVLTAKAPVVELSAFRDVNFALGSLFSFVLGIGLYGLTYLYPLYLGNVRGYDSLMIGETVFVSGLAMFFSAPLTGFLSTRIDLRLMLLIGFMGFAYSTWMLTGLTADWDFGELLVPQILRGMSVMLCMVPINDLALGTLTPDKLKNASGLFNLTRNLGGAVGLAIINTLLINRNDLHYERLSEAVSWHNPEAVKQLEMMAGNLAAQGITDPSAALSQMAGRVLHQAAVMSFIDVFFVITGLFTVLGLFAVMMRKSTKTAPGGSGH